MRTTDTIKVNVIDTRSIGSLTRANKILDNYESTPVQLEHHMKALFAEDHITPEMIVAYNLMEARWKMLTKYKTNNNHVI